MGTNHCGAGNVITVLPSVDHSAVLASDTNTDVTASGQTGTQTIRLRKSAKPIVDFSFDFNAGNRDLSSIVASRDDNLKAAVIHGISGHTGVSGNITLYVPFAANHTRVRYCSGKETIGCTSADSWSATWDINGALLETNNGFDAGSFSVSVVTLDGESVWKIVGPISSGGQGEGDVPFFSWWSLLLALMGCVAVLHRKGLLTPAPLLIQS